MAVLLSDVRSFLASAKKDAFSIVTKPVGSTTTTATVKKKDNLP